MSPPFPEVQLKDNDILEHSNLILNKNLSNSFKAIYPKITKQKVIIKKNFPYLFLIFRYSLNFFLPIR